MVKGMRNKSRAHVCCVMPLRHLNEQVKWAIEYMTLTQQINLRILGVQMSFRAMEYRDL